VSQGKPARILALATTLVFLCGVAVASEVSLATKDVRVPPGHSYRIDFDMAPQKNLTILLELLCRLDAVSYAGSNYLMKIALNGQTIKASKTRNVARLKNRPIVAAVTSNASASWISNGVWRILYAPDFETTHLMTYYEGNPYRIVLDITDLLNPRGRDSLEITNLVESSATSSAGTKGELVLRDVKIDLQPGPSPTLLSGTLEGEVINRGTPGAGPAPYTVDFFPGGGLRVKVGQDFLDLTTKVSYPNAGFNYLLPSNSQDTISQTGRKVKVEPSADGGRILAQGPDYRLARTVHITKRRIEISDLFTNLHANQNIGLLVQNQVSLKGKNAVVRLAGNPDPDINEYFSYGNPSVYASLQDHGLGMICEDDVFRNQATLFYDVATESMGLRTDMLCLRPGASYTLHWSLYPVASGDYYDFVNLVRSDWGSNYTVDGAWTFFDPNTILATPLEDIRRNFSRLGIKYACSWGGWADGTKDSKKIGFGADVLQPYWEHLRNALRNAAIKIRQAVPECKVLLYYNSQRNSFKHSTDTFRDSVLTDPQGKVVYTDWSGQFDRTWNFVPTLENSFGRIMLQVAKLYMDDLRADGLYWDEMENIEYGRPLITYNCGDGYSCLLDDKALGIKQEIGLTTILGERFRLAVIDLVKAEGGTILGNGPVATTRLLGARIPRMIEIQHNDVWCFEGDLQSPLGYSGSRIDFGNWVRAIRLGKLLVGTRYDYNHELSRYVFPFTPVELHSGYLLGKERIVTIHSGLYGWVGEKNLVRVAHFNRDGVIANTEFTTSIGSEARTKVDLDEGEVAVLERLPINVEPIGCGANIDGVVYQHDVVAFKLRDATKAHISMSSSPTFPISGGEKFKISFGDDSRVITADNNGRIAFDVLANGATTVDIVPQRLH